MLCSSLIMILLLLMMMMATMVMVETVARLMIPNTSSRSYWCIGLPQSSPIAQHIIFPYFYYFFYFYYFSTAHISRQRYQRRECKIFKLRGIFSY